MRLHLPRMGLGRVELPTSRLSGVRSNHLSYRPLLKRGTAKAERGTVLPVPRRGPGRACSAFRLPRHSQSRRPPPPPPPPPPRRGWYSSSLPSSNSSSRSSYSSSSRSSSSSISSSRSSRSSSRSASSSKSSNSSSSRLSLRRLSDHSTDVTADSIVTSSWGCG